MRGSIAASRGSFDAIAHAFATLALFAFAVALSFACAACTLPPAKRTNAPRTPPPPDVVSEGAVTRDLDAARALDHQGVLAFQAGRYRDAQRLFRESRRLGGPPSEIWNAARCHEKLDEPELAMQAIDEYLAERTLTQDERGEAERERERLKTLPSVLDVITAPPGATVTIDGQAVNGATPLAADLPAGTHALVVKKDGHQPKTISVEARFGRAVIVEIELVKAAK